MAGRIDWLRWLPGLRTLHQYNAAWLQQDLWAGLVLASMLVPVGIAYAVASGLPGIYGLYATIIPLLAYALFGPSRILVLGPDLGPGRHHPQCRAFIVRWRRRTCCRVGRHDGYRFGDDVHPGRRGAPRLRYRTSFEAHTVRLHERDCVDGVDQSTPQAVRLLHRERRTDQELMGHRSGDTRGKNELDGVSDRSGHAGRDLASEGQQAFTGNSDCGRRGNRHRCSAGPRCAQRRGGSGAASAGFTVVRGPLDCPDRHRPSADRRLRRRPGVVRRHERALAGFAARTGSKVDPNQELIGLGVANLVTGFFQGFPISSSSSRTPVAEAAGARTQLTCVVGALAITLLLLVAPNLLQHLPTTALAAVVIAAAIGLIETADLGRIYRIQRWEFWLSVACFAGVAVLGVIPGIGLAIAIAIIEFLWDGWRPYSAVLGRAHGVEGYHDITRFPNARRIPGLVLFRWDAPLFFANAELFKERVLDAVAQSPTSVRWFVVAAEPVTSVDVTSADVLFELHETLHDKDIGLVFAELKDPVKDKLKRFGLFARLGEESFFPTIGSAVARYRKTHHVDWVDKDETKA